MIVVAMVGRPASPGDPAPAGTHALARARGAVLAGAVILAVTVVPTLCGSVPYSASAVSCGTPLRVSRILPSSSTPMTFT
jgi:hypothetical protein